MEFGSPSEVQKVFALIGRRTQGQTQRRLRQEQVYQCKVKVYSPVLRASRLKERQP
jgi:hypothetical protein